MSKKLIIEINLDHFQIKKDLNAEVTDALTRIADMVHDKDEIVMPIWDSSDNEQIGQWSITEE